MTTFIKSIFVILLCMLAHMAIQAQSEQWRHLYPNIVIYKSRPIDTTKTPLTPEMRSYFARFERINQLGHEHFLLNNMGPQNLGVRFDKKSELYEGLGEGNATSVLIKGNTDVEFIAQDVNPKNAKKYLYRVIQNNERELQGWTHPTQFKTTSDGKYTYAWLGKFAYQPEQMLKIEIYNITNFKEQDAVIIDWRKVVAATVAATADYLSYYTPIPDNGLVSKPLYPMQQAITVMKNGKVVPLFPPEKDFIQSVSSQDLRIRLADSLQKITFFIRNQQKTYNYKFSLKRVVKGVTDSITLGEGNNGLELFKEFWKMPGKYQVTFTPKIHRHGGEPIYLLRNLATSINFTVLPAVNTPYSISVTWLLVIVGSVLVIAVLVIVYYRTRQKRILFQQVQSKEIINLQLGSVRAQLNPHFIFNALAGIQNLVNKNEMENANKYLVRFARITRNVLDGGNKELTSIQREMDLLKDCLEMEQMRFGFTFSINTNDDIVDQQVEIPAMLLQPFVENAVKHGISAMKDAGMIRIDVVKNDNTLLLTVWDNGNGFEAAATTGMGIKLCEKRIQLLNSIYKNTTILLHKGRENNGTLITIELKNWL
jgi:two-component system LytT family sensor kinase